MTRGDYMRQARQRAGLTLSALSKLSGVHQNTINAIETGRTQGTINTIEELADAIGISVDEYIGHVVTRSDIPDELKRYYGFK